MFTVKQILIFITQVFCIVCVAQTKHIDSLKKTLPLLKDTARIDCLNELGFEYSNPYWNKSHYVQTDTASLYTIQAMRESKIINYPRGIGEAFQNLGIIEEQRGNYIKSEQYTRLAIQLLEKMNMQAEYHRAIANRGWCAFYQGRYNEALHDYEEVLPYYKDIKDTFHIAMLYRMTGNAYMHEGYSESAFRFFQKNKEIKKGTDDLIGIGHTTEFNGDLYLVAGDTAKALFFYSQSAESAKAKNVANKYDYPSMKLIYTLKHQYDSALYAYQQDLQTIQLTYTDSFLKKKALVLDYLGIAEIYSMLNNYDQSLAYCQEPLKVFREQGNLNDLMTVLKFTAMAYLGKHNGAKSLYYAKQLLNYAEKSGARPFIRDGYMILWQNYDNLNKISFAYQYHLKYTALNDSIKSDNYKANIAAWDAISKSAQEKQDYETEKKITGEKNKAKIELMNKEKQRQLYIFISTIIAGLTLFFFFFYNAKHRRRKQQLLLQMTEANAQLEKKIKEKEVAELQQQKTELELQALRAQMNPHFIFNCLNSINRFIINNDAVKAADYLTKFAKLIRIVLQQSGKPFIPLEDELKCLQLYMDLEVLRFEIPFKYEINCDGIDTASVLIPTLLIQPFVENAIWHGLHTKTNGNGIINVSMNVRDDVLHCKICDNGIGRSAAIKEERGTAKKSLGINLTEHRLQLIDPLRKEKAGIEIHDLINNSGQNAGTCVDIKIPVKSI